MAGPLDGLKVLDLSWGIAGPMASMLLSDQGAQVTKIERPGAGPFDDFSGTRVWSRGKRSAVLDLASVADRDAFYALVDSADVVLESFSPGVTTRLGIDYETLAARNPRLVYCSITVYGRGNPHEQRPGYEALVAACTGSHWAQRGGIMSSTDFDLPPVEIPEGAEQGARKEGPVFTYSPWLSITTCYQATMGVVAAVLAREATGRGQWVEASLVPPGQVDPGATVADGGGARAPIAGSWMSIRGAPKGLFECADGRWVHQWALKPLTIIQASEYGKLADAPAADYASRMQDPNRIGMEPSAIVEIFYYFPLMVEAFKKFTADEWVEWGARVKEGVQPIRAPEEALEDPLCLDDGCVVEVNDPELGVIRHVGLLQDFGLTPGSVQGPAPRRGEHTDEVRADAAGSVPDRRAGSRPGPAPSTAATMARPLEGIRVLDLGVALAGPFANVQLANLGAEVIKVNAPHDAWWLHTAMGQSANFGKRSVVLDLKSERGLELLYELVKTADVVAHNMRYGTPEKLGVDYGTLRKHNPRIVYCQSYGFDKTRSAMRLPGTDQAGSALGGQEWEDGGCSNGGRPFFGTSMGDLGNGYLSAISIIEALYHRSRTGEGQRVGTAIMKACLLSSSYAFVDADGTPAPRPRLDAMQLGLSALYRLYEAADGEWLCIACVNDAHWAGLGPALGRPELVSDLRFATAGKRAVHDGALARILEGVFAQRPAAEWRDLLDDHGVPGEVSSNKFVDGPVGPVVGLSDTPARIPGPAPRLGQHSREILESIGLTRAEIDELIASGVSFDGAADAASEGAPVS